MFTHPARDSFHLFGTERLKVHTYVPLHSSKQFLGGAVGRVCLLPPIALVPSRNDPLILTAIHIQVIGLEGICSSNPFIPQLRHKGTLIDNILCKVLSHKHLKKYTHTTKDFRGQVLIKLTNDNPHIIVL